MNKQLRGAANNSIADVYAPGMGVSVKSIPTVVSVETNTNGNPTYAIVPALTSDPAYLGPPVSETTTGSDPAQQPPVNTDPWASNTFYPSTKPPIPDQDVVKDHTPLPPVSENGIPAASASVITPLKSTIIAGVPNWLLLLGIGVGLYMLVKPSRKNQ